jgi:hypothetical protein
MANAATKALKANSTPAPVATPAPAPEAPTADTPAPAPALTTEQVYGPDTLAPAPAPTADTPKAPSKREVATAATKASFEAPGDPGLLAAAVAALAALPSAQGAEVLSAVGGALALALTADPEALSNPDTLAALLAVKPHSGRIEAALSVALATKGKAPSDPTAATLALGRKALALALLTLSADNAAREAFGGLTPAQGADVLSALAADLLTLSGGDEAAGLAWASAHGGQGKKATAATGGTKATAAATALAPALRNEASYVWQGGKFDGATFTKGEDGLWSVTLATGATAAKGEKSPNKAALAMLGGGSVNVWDYLALPTAAPAPTAEAPAPAPVA